MKITTILISTFLTWTAYDLNLFRRQRRFFTLSVVTASLPLEEDELRQAEEVQRHRLDVIPPGRRKIPRPVRSKCNYFSSKPRDSRYSDQRKIRRRINNL